MDSMPARPPRRRRARPVPDAPVDALLPRAEELAKGWLLALLEDAPLGDAASIVSGGVVRDGPQLCEAVVRAMASDAGVVCQALETPVELSAFARRPDDISRAVETLRAVLWSALLSELRDPDPELVAALSERLAVLIELVRGAALRSAGSAPGTSWLVALDAEIERATGSGKPLSLLLVELEDAERLLAVEPVDETRAMSARVAAAIEGAARPAATVAPEADERFWIIAPECDRLDAEALALRIDSAVRAGEGWRGAPLVIIAGIAVLGEDADDRSGLIDAAEQARFAAAAEGITVVRGQSRRND